MTKTLNFRTLQTISIILTTMLMVLLSAGCATYKTVSVAKYGSSAPKIYSGTRFNIHAISDNRYELNKVEAEPPKYPILDLPASFALDTIILPMSISTVVSEKIGL